MNLFLDTCVIIGYNVEADPQHKVVGNFIKEHGVDLESNVTTCNKVVDEVNANKRKIRRRLKNSSLNNEDISVIMGKIDKYIKNIIEIVDYSKEGLCSILFAYIIDDLTENIDDIEVFSNFVIWSIKHNPVPKKPVFLTTDSDDYDKIDDNGDSVALNSVKNCFNKTSVSLNNPLELVILKNNNIKWYNY